MASQLSQVADQLTSSTGLRPNRQWLQALLATQRPSTPLQALVQTARFRFLACDITESVARDACLPSDINDPQVKERKLYGRIAVQVMGIEDISKSRWEQIEALEAIERGEGTKGREIIRVAATDDNAESTAAPRLKGGVHKLLLQDVAGNRAYGLELKPVEGVGLGMSIGCKLILSEAVVARGVVMLAPTTTIVVGGKVEGIHKAWKQNRKADLRRGIEEQGG